MYREEEKKWEVGEKKGDPHVARVGVHGHSRFGFEHHTVQVQQQMGGRRRDVHIRLVGAHWRARARPLRRDAETILSLPQGRECTRVDARIWNCGNKRAFLVPLDPRVVVQPPPGNAARGCEHQHHPRCLGIGNPV